MDANAQAAAVMMQQPEDAANDWAAWLEELILGRDLTPQEEEQVLVKTKFWWAVATEQRDALIRFHSRN